MLSHLLETLCKFSVHLLKRLHSFFPSLIHPTAICREPPVSQAPGTRREFKRTFPEGLSHLRGNTFNNSYGEVLPQKGTGCSKDPGRELIQILRKWSSGPAAPHRAFLAPPPAGSSPKGREAHGFPQERASQARPLPDKTGPHPATHPTVAQLPASRIFSSYFKLPPLNQHLRKVSWVSSPLALRPSGSHPLGPAEEKLGSTSRKGILVASELAALG